MVMLVKFLFGNSVAAELKIDQIMLGNAGRRNRSLLPEGLLIEA